MIVIYKSVVAMVTIQGERDCVLCEVCGEVKQMVGQRLCSLLSMS